MEPSSSPRRSTRQKRPRVLLTYRTSSSKRHRRSRAARQAVDLHENWGPLKQDLPEELQIHALSFLSAGELGRFRVCCPGTRHAWVRVSRMDRLWKPLATRLWETKARHATEPFRRNAEQGKSSWHRAFADAVRDSTRTRLRGVAELSSLRFWFRFKEAAGEYWTDMDPSWRFEEPMLRRFLPNGQFEAPPGDPIHYDPEVRSFIKTIRWRFTKTKKGKRGLFIKVNHWPSYTATRNASDWTWQLDAVWVCYRTVTRPSLPDGQAWKHTPI